MHSWKRGCDDQPRHERACSSARRPEKVAREAPDRSRLSLSRRFGFVDDLKNGITSITTSAHSRKSHCFGIAGRQ